VNVSVRLGERSAPDWAADWGYVRDLGRRTAMTSVASIRPAPQAAVGAAFERLCDLVESQSHAMLIARRGDERVGFLLLLDSLPDEVTLMPQGFLAYMAVEPAWQRRGIGSALLRAAEDEARRRGLPYMALMVTEENAAARKLYDGCGYFTERRLLCKLL
jgi:ribosomal protein S18 acetylase RimI-like enzyme